MRRGLRFLVLAGSMLALAACGTGDWEEPDSDFDVPLVSMQASCTAADGSVDLVDPALTSDGDATWAADWRYEVYLPSDWETLGTRRLVLFAHGYFDPHRTEKADGSPIPDPALPIEYSDEHNVVVCNLLANGIAVAWSSYEEDGYDVEGGVSSTHELGANLPQWLQDAERAAPTRTYLVGYSQGGTVAVKLAEVHGGAYDGALSLCGPVNGFEQQVDYVGHVRAVFDHYFQGNYAGGVTPVIPLGPATTEPESLPAVNLPSDSSLVPWELTLTPDPSGNGTYDVPTSVDGYGGIAREIVRTLETDLATARLAAGIDQLALPHTNDDELVHAFASALFFNVRGTPQFLAKAGGSPLDTRSTTYTGSSASPDELDALNSGVIRYAPFSYSASAPAEDYLAEHYTSTGDLGTRFLTLHTTLDPMVPYGAVANYAAKVDAQRRSSRLARQHVQRYGHCNFKTEEIIGALNELVKWVEYPWWLFYRPITGDVTIPDSDGGSANAVPISDFAYSCTELGCEFDGSGSSDPEGSIDSYAWDFGDGTTATGVSANHTYGAAGTYTVTLVVTDDLGATDSSSRSVSVTARTDEAPSVEITSPADGASFESGTSISFAGNAGDTEDGDLTSSIVWNSNIAGEIGTGGSFGVTLTEGTHTITASVTDSAEQTSSASITITVELATSGIALSADGYKVKGRHHVDLAWSGAASTNVEVYRDGGLLTTTNASTYTDATDNRGGASYTYEVCEAGTSTCSAPVIVTF